MNTPPPVTQTQPSDPRRRLRELLSIPERDRTEEQWDEIVELEIQLAPGNRVGFTGTPTGGKAVTVTGGNAGNPQQQRKHRPKGNNPRRPKANKPPRDPA